MKNVRKLLLSGVCAAGAVWFCAACASTIQPAMDEHFVSTPNDEIRAMLGRDYSAASAGEESLKPGLFYVSPDFAKIFQFDSMESEIDENGFLVGRVFGWTAEQNVLAWAFCGDIPYRTVYRFLWFDADGKLVKLDKPLPFQIREIMPGDPVRFSQTAPNEQCKQFSFCIALLDSKEEQIEAHRRNEALANGEAATTEQTEDMIESVQVAEGIVEEPPENPEVSDPAAAKAAEQSAPASSDDIQLLK